ncbi:lantibiotic dehydratase [Chitinophaga sp. Cy-1792]|uniref:lantibiotic dehydratase n=1 Tax=Chitinophaga sp. Cy-1792 TaxID=2608339 RepID=UPI001422CD92|nr:lantibiotic dehydratase [Chitinophaga sp. Cy-1792]NIG55002.1 hypothetical protein [Chitinophaga sp. Cy-1792]
MPLSHAGFFLLRSPLFPVDSYREVLNGDLNELLTTYPLFIYALHIASKDLLKELERYISDPAAFTPKKVLKLRKSLYKYWVRACTRSTPYGLFAGCTTGVVSDATEWQLAPMSEARQHIRLDMDYFTKICHHIQQLPEVQGALRYYPNNSIYSSGKKLRYAEYMIQFNRRKYLLTAVADTVFVRQIITKAKNGITIQEAVQLIIAEDNTIALSEAEDFVQELIRSQLLIAETEPRITGNDNLETLIKQLDSLENVTALKHSLSDLSKLFQQQDFQLSRLIQMEKACEEGFPLEMPKDLLQVDLFKAATHCTVSEHLMQDILRQVNELMAICHGYPKNGQSELSSFADRFRERYDAEEVPLNLVLDGETGIGYGNGTNVHTPFVEDIETAGTTENTTVTWSALQQLCLDKYEGFLRNGGPVTITESELKELGDPEQLPMARSTYLFGGLHATSAAAADSGVYTFALHSMGGPSAANLLGRFCSGDEVLAEKVKAVLQAEEAADPDVIYAEVVHFPEARATNVLIRPVLRQYEIPYIGVAGVAPAYQIPVDDLMISLRGREVVLRSKRLNKQVIPRLSSAHNYSFNSLPIYKFLCDLQHQSLVSHLYWDWGILSKRVHLPRVVYKNIIVKRAGWNISAKDIEKIADNAAGQMAFVASFRQRYNMPEKVLLSQADNELLLDLSAPLAVELLFDHIRKAGTVKLKECLLEEENGVLRDDAGKTYAHEILVPLQFTPKQTAVTTGRHLPENTTIATRNFAPGSEWLYVKIYCGYRVAEELLAGYFAEQLSIWKEDELFEKFFFLRYADPHPHIRLRFLNTQTPSKNDFLLHQVQQAMVPFIATGQVQKIQCDTYVRELERYGADTIELAESIFYFDSLAVTGIISMLEGADGEEYRWKLALRGMDMMLDDFGLTLTQKRNLLGVIRAGFVTEFGGQALLHKPLNDKYRQHQQEIQSYLNAANDAGNDIAEAVELFLERSAAARPVTAIIRERCTSEEEYLRFIASQLHMFINRLFVGKQRKHELVLYHFLEKYYLSQLAQEAIAR